MWTNRCTTVCVCVCLLTVEAKVFREGLGNEELKALGHKVANGPGVFVQTAGGEALIGRVEEDEQVPPLKNQRGSVNTIVYRLLLEVYIR